MRVMLLDAYFNPEIISFTHLENDLIEGLVKAGHQIDIICPIPTRGVDKETVNRYKKLRYEELFNGKVHVHRFWAPQERTNPIFRAFRYIWCNLREYQVGKKIRETNVIFANSTPPTQGWIAGKLKKKLNCMFVYSLQDLFPDSLVTTGLTNEKSFYFKIGNILADTTYAAANSIVVISESFKKKIIAKGVPESKINLIYNWVDTDEVHHIDKNENKLFEELNIPRGIPTIVYAGNFGASQNGGIIIDVAKKLVSKKIQFVLFGGGSEYPAIRSRVIHENVHNVITFDLMPINRVSEVYSLGDIALITNAPGVGECGMPSKLWTIMATETPIVASVDISSELAKIIKDAGGEVVRAGDVDGLSDILLKSINNLPLCNCDKLSMNALVHSLASKAIAVSRYLELLEA